MLITSKNNEQIKEYCQLKKSRKERYKQGKFTVEGVKVCLEALNSKFECVRIFATEQTILKYPEITEKSEQRNIEITEISEELSVFLADTQTPQGVYIVCKMLDKMQYLDKIEYNGNYMILESLQDPGNLGTIIRTADALGIGMLYITSDCTDIYSPKVIRSTTGSIFRQNFMIIDDACSFIKELSKCGAVTYGAVLHHDSVVLGTFKFPVFSGAVIGNEGNGMSKEAISSCDKLLTIPMSENTESLNAGLAAGIIMWEMSKNNG